MPGSESSDVLIGSGAGVVDRDTSLALPSLAALEERMATVHGRIGPYRRSSPPSRGQREARDAALGGWVLLWFLGFERGRSWRMDWRRTERQERDATLLAGCSIFLAIDGGCSACWLARLEKRDQDSCLLDGRDEHFLPWGMEEKLRLADAAVAILLAMVAFDAKKSKMEVLLAHLE
jgi:hypothetical protein